MNTEPKQKTPLQMSIGYRQLETAGFKVLRSLRFGKWYEVVAPTGEEGAVLRIGPNSWHFFGVNFTASGSSAAGCLSGGLGDVIGTDGQLKTYERHVRNAPEYLASIYCIR
jgi:hypothetical protein